MLIYGNAEFYTETGEGELDLFHQRLSEQRSALVPLEPHNWRSCAAA